MQGGDVFLAPVQVPTPCDKVVAFISEQLQELRNQREVVCVIGVAYDQVVPAGAFKPPEICFP